MTACDSTWPGLLPRWTAVAVKISQKQYGLGGVMSPTQSATSHRAIVDEVIEKLLETLVLRDAFDVYTIERLAELAAGGDLSSHQKVEQVIKSDSRSIQCGSSN
jgi:hypothetical protein